MKALLGDSHTRECMCMSLDRRLQLLLDEERYARIAAIDSHTSASPERRAAAWARICAADPMPVLSPAALSGSVAARTTT